ncbi:hypothetical protein ACH5RR_034197, partial [Cinchona calisaya]
MVKANGNNSKIAVPNNLDNVSSKVLQSREDSSRIAQTEGLVVTRIVIEPIKSDGFKNSRSNSIPMPKPLIVNPFSVTYYTQILESVHPKFILSDEMVEVLLARENGGAIELSSSSNQALLLVACEAMQDSENLMDSEVFIEEKLGRVLVSLSWNAEYDSACLVKYTNESSYHIMVLLNTILKSIPFKRWFAFDQRWLKYNAKSVRIVGVAVAHDNRLHFGVENAEATAARASKLTFSTVDPCHITAVRACFAIANTKQNNATVMGGAYIAAPTPQDHNRGHPTKDVKFVEDEISLGRDNDATNSTIVVLSVPTITKYKNSRKDSLVEDKVEQGQNRRQGVEDFDKAFEKKNSESEPIRSPFIVEEVSMDDDDNEEAGLFFDDLEDGELDEDNDYLEDENIEEELRVGDGSGGGGISLAETSWDKTALEIAEEVALSFNGELGIYAFRTLLNSSIQVRIERLTNKSGSPTMMDIEAFTSAYRELLDEAEVGGSIPDNITLE